MIRLLDNLKHRFEKLPLVQNILTELSNYLADGKAEKQLSELLMKKSGGLFAFLGKFIAGFASFLLNILMTFFFFSLLLGKLAQFQKSRSGAGEMPATGYLVRTVFNGKWLPQMSEENLRDGDRIVGEVCSKLRIWLRGYMTMIAIDFCVYTLAFTLLRVPYAPLLAAGAALGILLPYIGPISSALISVLVTLAVGGADASVMQVAGVIGIYLLHNGIVEQFFIYPAIIGESLGLTTLETIIVVLLGGIIAGIPGLIFALPVASVIKYLVPQIYRCWR
jgi:predicted PurR-regulated permease PerM